MTVVGINTGKFPRRVMFAFTSGSLSPSARFRAIRTGDHENWRNLGAIPPTANGFAATLPPRSVTTFIHRAPRHRSPPKP